MGAGVGGEAGEELLFLREVEAEDGVERIEEASDLAAVRGVEVIDGGVGDETSISVVRWKIS